MTDADIVRDIAHMIRDALQARVALVVEGSEGVEYETQLVRERLKKEGINADLRAIRVGEYFKRYTEFNLLQRIHRAIQSRVDGQPVVDDLTTEEEVG